MKVLRTPRLLLAPTPLHVLKWRLEQDEFSAPLDLEGRTLDVSFTPEWPGDALALFPLIIEQLEEDPHAGVWGGTLIERRSNFAVGQMGLKGPPDEQGRVEVGYGVNPSLQGRGFATEMLGALVAWAVEQPKVDKVTAECLTSNAGSIRVLEKANFERVGQREDEEGRLFLWDYSSPSS